MKVKKGDTVVVIAGKDKGAGAHAHQDGAAADVLKGHHASSWPDARLIAARMRG